MHSRQFVWIKVTFVAVFLLCASFASAGPDHTNFIQSYNGSSTCLTCHEGRDAEMMDSVHFQWRTESDKVEYPGGGSHGMLDRACGLVGSSAMINYYESCGKCHVGSSLPFPDPQTGEFSAAQKNDVDCLICHATDYDTNNDGLAEAGELAGDRPLVDGKWYQDRSLEAARTVGLPTTDACLRCHHHGQADYTYKRGTPFEHETDVHAAAGMTCTDCHFTDKHKIARGSRVSDMFANDLPDVDVTCESCHTEAPHETLVKLNDHIDKIACETCHIPELAGAQRRIWAPTFGVTEGPEANVPILNPDTGLYEPYSVYDDGFVSPSYRWFNGNSSMLAEPIDTTGAWNMQPASRATTDAKIYPFRKFVSGQPMDALGMPGTPTFDANFTMQAGLEGMAPMLKAMGFMRPDGLTAPEVGMMSQFPNMLYFDRAHYFLSGDVTESISIGLAKMGGMMQGMDVSTMSTEQLLGMGAQMWSGQFAGLALPNNPYAPGYLDDQDPSTVTGSAISVSHAIKKDGALSCKDCHVQEGRLDFAELGYSETMQDLLSTLAEEAPDHAALIGDIYTGPQQCEVCHKGAIEQMQGSTHYKFESELPAGYQRDHDGNPATHTRSGKMWKLCGFPTALPQSNWLGKLRDLPETDHIDNPGGCAKCHVGIGGKPFTATGKTEPQASEAQNMDCLICHAKDYNRKFYQATGSDITTGTTVVLAVPRTDGVLDWSVYTEAAKTVGNTSADSCLRCHVAAGGGKLQVDDLQESLKRGLPFDAENDVHAAAGLTCSNCHYAGDHRFKRPLNNDLSAHDVVVDHQMCIDCHTGPIHKANPTYDMHVSKISCTTCHAGSPGGAHIKDFSQPVAPDPADPLGTWGLVLEKTVNQAPTSFNWFNGTVGPEITPLGSRADGLIYPFKRISFVQPMDANNNPIPVKWGKFFLTGDMEAAVAMGRDLYSSGIYTAELAAATGIPAVPGEFDHYGESHNGGFSVSHAITKDNAKTCADCHASDGLIDFDALGYTPTKSLRLQTLLSPGPVNHADFIGAYAGPKTCEECHPGKTIEMQGSTHYKFEGDLPAGYQNDENGNPVSYTRSGKLWKLCGFPTAMASHNWMGALQDDPSTPNVDTPGGCAKCHVGIGMKPFNAVGQVSPSVAEADNMDCLVCHADPSVYKRKYYISTAGGEPVLNALGSPVVMTVPKADGVFDWSVYTAAAGTVGKTSTESCQVCHAAAGGGKMMVDGTAISLKRGELFDSANDVHADSLSCSDCHYDGGHRFKRPRNNDLSAYDNAIEGDMCTTCHGSAPHEDGSRYNSHIEKISCTTCHTNNPGGSHFKDFSDHKAPDPNNPLAIWGLGMIKTERSAPVEHSWFNGTVGPEIKPLGSSVDGKIYPFKRIRFVVPQDANNYSIPVKWGTYFKTGNMIGAATTGRDLYSTLYTPLLAAATGIPPVPGEFDHYGEGHKAVFSIGHGITKDNAKTCGDCHKLGGDVDFASLGYSEEAQAGLEHRVVRPLDLSASQGEYSYKVMVSWPVVTGAGAYRVWRADSEEGDKVAVSGWVSGVSFDDTSAKFGIDYYYWVQAAENAAGEKESPLSPVAIGSVAGVEVFEKAYLITAKKCTLVMDSPSSGSISLVDTSAKSSLKIKFLKKGIPAVIKEKPGQYYITAASIPELFIMGEFGKVYTDAPIDNLFGEGALKGVTAKNCNVGNMHISGHLGSVKITALENAGGAVSTFASTRIMTGAGSTKLKVNLVGVILEGLTTDQPVTYVKTASKKFKDADKNVAVSLAGIGSVGRVVDDVVSGGSPAQSASGSVIIAPMGISTISTNGGPIVCDSITAPVKKIQAGTAIFVTGNGMIIAGGNIRVQVITSDMVMAAIQAKLKAFSGEAAGGFIGYPGTPGATQIFVQGVSTIDGQGGVSAAFFAGFDASNGNPNYSGVIKNIRTKAGDLEGTAHCSNQPKFKPEQGGFEVIN